ncbi:efflux RND transporter periplasmic adaptor subunit [Rhizomicrobium electricum]|uniref:Efflux RND transporter periplasmic adaptor subunit n=1 Tax=Rhizomicrobium electricum TaxID=480070 RepID=A0ABP3PIZ2_9PROT|nr:HlyD family efflux transporter periplasmic adaptor subunit [Rhizomicrobium electricum]NIJ47166.1 HlyD family secretion protein [Rhizomicrobium electricum]
MRNFSEDDPAVPAMDRVIAKAPSWRRYWPYGAAAAAVLLAGIWLMIAGGGRVYRVSMDQVTIGTVASGAFEDFAAVRGTVAPFITNYLTTDQGGTVKQILVEDGAIVKKDQPLIVLANPTLQLEVAAREADTARQMSEVENTRLQLEQTRLDHQKSLFEIDHEVESLTADIARDKRLFEAKALASATYEKDKSKLAYVLKVQSAIQVSHGKMEGIRREQLAQLKTTLVRLNTNLEAARQSIEALTIRAPMDGQLTALDALAGQSKPQGAVLGQVDSLDRFKLTAQVDEFYLGRVRTGQQAISSINGRDYKATVAKVYTQVSNGTFKVDLAFTGAVPTGVHNGQAVEIKLQLGGTTKALLLPSGPFYQDGGGTWVFLLDGKTAKRRAVKLGRRNPEFVEVLEGLKPGDRVIVSSYSAYQNIDRVELESK